MRWLLSVGTGVSLVVATILAFVPTRVRAQEVTPADVERQIRASLSAWNARDPVRIVDTPGLSSDFGFGFGYRARAPRAGATRENQLVTVREILASLEYNRATLDELHTAVDGNIGLAWGFFIEEFRVRGRAPETVRVRFTTTLKWEHGKWRQLLFHRDAQPFDDKGNYIPAVPALK